MGLLGRTQRLRLWFGSGAFGEDTFKQKKKGAWRALGAPAKSLKLAFQDRAACEFGSFAEHFFYPDQLVILCQPVRTGE